MAFRKPIKWSSPSLSTQELIDRYGNRLPIIAMVTKGYYGEDEIDTLASNQVRTLLLFSVFPGREIRNAVEHYYEF